MGRCELLISIVPPTSAAFKSHINKLLKAQQPCSCPPLALFSCQLWNQLTIWYVHQKTGGLPMPNGSLGNFASRCLVGQLLHGWKGGLTLASYMC